MTSAFACTPLSGTAQPLVHLVMRAGCATRDYDWALARTAEFWDVYNRSIVHRSAFVGLLAHGTHTRLLLNHHVERGGKGDLDALVRGDIKPLKRLPSSRMREVAIARTQARVAFLQGDRARATALQRTCLEKFEKTQMRQELAHDQYTLGLLVGGAEGAQLIAAATATLRACGISDPEANMQVYVPELMR